MKSVWILTVEKYYSNVGVYGIQGVYSTEEKALQKLEKIKQDVINWDIEEYTVDA